MRELATVGAGDEYRPCRRIGSRMLFDLALLAAVLTCSLVSGLLLGFAIVAMPGLGTLDDRAFLRGFQVMDRVIQDRQPVFMALWLGSAVAVVVAALAGLDQVEGSTRTVLLGGAALYLVGVQVPTAAINIPLNDEVQALDLDSATGPEVAAARERFEARWNRSNAIRSALGVIASLLLAVVALQR